MSSASISFDSTAPEAKTTAPFVASGGGAYRKPIVVASLDSARNSLANKWTWDNLLNGSNNLQNPNPYGNGFAMKYNWY
jgi:hypothetical protein